MAAQPVRYDPSIETPADDEEETHRALIETTQSINDTTSRDYGHAVRSVHAKSHGLMEGELVVADGLPPELAQGLFAAPGTYRVVLRLSTNPGDVLDDAVSAPRGMALKILGVPGERLPESQDETTQNILMADAPAFAAKDAAAFLATLKQLAATTDKAEWAKKLLSATLRGAERVVEAVGGQVTLFKQMGGAQPTHPLGERFWSQTPYRYGDHVAKFSLVPVSPSLTSLTDERVNVDARPDALREVVGQSLIEQGGTWDLRVQLQTDREAMPIEDASVPWDEEASAFRTVATITVDPQVAWSPARAAVVDEGLYFSPWHGLAAHRPLGSVNRARRRTYESSAEFRGRFNGCPIHEPRTLAPLPV